MQAEALIIGANHWLEIGIEVDIGIIQSLQGPKQHPNQKSGEAQYEEIKG